MNSMSKLKVSVVMITYGHEKFIEKAINSVLMQVVDFEVELIVANDKSPDNTDLVIQHILRNHPKASWINYINRNENLNIMPNFMDAMNQCNGEYIAICEGDDYWIDPLKLQKQVDFLESNPEYSMSCHNAEIIYENSDKKPIIFSKNSISYDISMQTIVEKWVIPTASMVFRREHVVNLPEWFNKIYSGDFSLALLLRHSGKIRFFNDIMSVYRIDFSGSSASATYGKRGIFVFNQHISLLNYFNTYTTFKYAIIIEKRISQIKEELRFLELKEKGFLNAFFGMPIVFFQKGFSKIYYFVKVQIKK